MSSTRDAEAAKRFFVKALHGAAGSVPQVCPIEKDAALPTTPANPGPRVINVEKNAAYPKAMAGLNVDGVLHERVELRPVKYLNNMIEQDHRFLKRLTKPGMGFFSFETAWRTLQGFEIMNMVRKGHVHGVAKGDGKGQVALIARLFGVGA